MARQVRTMILVKGELVADTPLHVGGLGASPDVDMTLAINGRGQYYVPGTSLAGALRGWMIQAFDEKTARAFWGYQKKDKGYASLAWIQDAVVKLPAGTDVEIRDGVGIDRVSGSAAEHILFSRMVLPRGSRLPLELTLELLDEVPEKSEQVGELSVEQIRYLLRELVQTLQAGGIRLGAGKSRGLGRIHLDDGVVIWEQNLSSPKGILETLRSGGRKIALEDLKSHEVHAKGRMRLSWSIDWEPTGPLMVKSAQVGLGVDMFPQMTWDGSQLTFVIPGSSIKGALRAQAERIVRTVAALSAPEEPELHSDQIERSAEGVELPIIPWLFGATGKPEEGSGGAPPGEDDKDDAPVERGLAALTVDDCFARRGVPLETWREITLAEEQEVKQKLKDAGLENVQYAFHVAVDRWTGGAAQTALFNALEPVETEYEPIRMDLDLGRLPSGDDGTPSDEQKAALALFLLVLQDLAQGMIPLGFGTTRGMGEIKVRVIRVTGENLPDWASALREATFDGSLAGLDPTLLDRLRPAWQKVCEGIQKGEPV